MQLGETKPFISELLTTLTTIIQDLQLHQIHMFYEAVGLMISADKDPIKRDDYLVGSCTSMSSTSQESPGFKPLRIVQQVLIQIARMSWFHFIPTGETRLEVLTNLYEASKISPYATSVLAIKASG